MIVSAYFGGKTLLHKKYNFFFGLINIAIHSYV